jgi:hypothetical protein
MFNFETDDPKFWSGENLRKLIGETVETMAEFGWFPPCELYFHEDRNERLYYQKAYESGLNRLHAKMLTRG